MPNASIASIRSALSTRLAAVSELKGGVLTGRTASFTGFPAARFYLIGIEEQKTDEDTFQNYRVYTFSIDVVMAIQINGVGKSASEGEFQDAVDAVLDKLATEWMLGGIVEQTSIETSVVRYEESAQGVATYLPIILKVKTLVST